MAHHSRRRHALARLTELFPDIDQEQRPGSALRDDDLPSGAHDPVDDVGEFDDDDAARPLRRVRWRLRLGVVGVVLAVLALGAGIWLSVRAASGSAEQAPRVQVATQASESGHSLAKASTGTASDAPAASGEASGAARTTVVVDVVGAVTHPGIVTLPSGSRVYQAINAAGGSTPEAATSALNLAAVLTDGSQIMIPTQAQVAAGLVPAAAGAPATAAASAGATRGSAPSSGKVNLNTATTEQLQTLPHVGPATAQKIIDWRAAHGKFTKVEDLDAVDGIGPKLLAQLSPLVTV